MSNFFVALVGILGTAFVALLTSWLTNDHGRLERLRKFREEFCKVVAYYRGFILNVKGDEGLRVEAKKRQVEFSEALEVARIDMGHELECALDEVERILLRIYLGYSPNDANNTMSFNEAHLLLTESDAIVKTKGEFRKIVVHCIPRLGAAVSSWISRRWASIFGGDEANVQQAR